MDIEIAARLIEKGIEKTSSPQIWADLGAGTGLFTKALSSLLSSDSTVYAVDKESTALEKIQLPSPSIKLITIHQDFLHDTMSLEPCDGILMANSLHFVSDKPTLMKRIKTLLKPSGKLILVEYDMEKSSAWVPYPIQFSMLNELAAEARFGSVTKLREEPSVFNNARMYSAMITAK